MIRSLNEKELLDVAGGEEKRRTLPKAPGNDGIEEVIVTGHRPSQQIKGLHDIYCPKPVGLQQPHIAVNGSGTTSSGGTSLGKVLVTRRTADKELLSAYGYRVINAN